MLKDMKNSYSDDEVEFKKKEPPVKLTTVEAAAMAMEDVNKYHYVSFRDVVKHPLFERHRTSFGPATPESVPKHVMLEILFKLGLDVGKRVKHEFHRHRTFDGTDTINKEHLFRGYMRRDQRFKDIVFREVGVRLV